MLKLEWKFQGKKMHSGQELGRAVSNWLRDSTLKAAASHIQNRIQGLRCAIHGQTPRVVGNPATTEFSIKGCCEELIAEVKARLGK